jgi:hypothetical protein
MPFTPAILRVCQGCLIASVSVRNGGCSSLRRRRISSRSSETVGLIGRRLHRRQHRYREYEYEKDLAHVNWPPTLLRFSGSGAARRAEERVADDDTTPIATASLGQPPTDSASRFRCKPGHAPLASPACGGSSRRINQAITPLRMSTVACSTMAGTSEPESATSRVNTPPIRTVRVNPAFP